MTEDLEALAASSTILRRRACRDVARAVIEAWGIVANHDTRIGSEAQRAIEESSRLSPPMVRWALETSLAPDRLASLTELAATLEDHTPRALASIVTAANVCTAAVPAISVALTARVPVFIKASSRDDALPRAFASALREVDEELARAVRVASFPGGTRSLEDPLFQAADVVIAYGNDSTLDAIAARLDGGTAFVRHGHGFGIGFVAREVPGDSALAFALDVAAYDQRGCLSPHAIFVERGGALDASALALALAEREDTLPRGRLDEHAHIAQAQWRGVAVATEELIDGGAWSVAHGANRFRVSPGHRNVTVVEVNGAADCFSALGPDAVAVKAVGVAGSERTREAMRCRWPGARVCPAGRMQLPPLCARADGHGPTDGLVV